MALECDGAAIRDSGRRDREHLAAHDSRANADAIRLRLNGQIDRVPGQQATSGVQECSALRDVHDRGRVTWPNAYRGDAVMFHGGVSRCVPTRPPMWGALRRRLLVRLRLRVAVRVGMRMRSGMLLPMAVGRDRNTVVEWN